MSSLELCGGKTSATGHSLSATVYFLSSIVYCLLSIVNSLSSVVWRWSSICCRLTAEAAEVGAVAGVEEDAGQGQADGKAHPDALEAKAGFEAEEVGGGDRYQIVTYEGGVHDRLDILNAAEDVGET